MKHFGQMDPTFAAGRTFLSELLFSRRGSLDNSDHGSDPLGLMYPQMPGTTPPSPSRVANPFRSAASADLMPSVPGLPGAGPGLQNHGPTMRPSEIVLATRTQLGLSVQAYAEWVGVSPRQVRRWESGENAPGRKFLEEITRIYRDIGEGDPLLNLEEDTQKRAETALLRALARTDRVEEIVALSEELRLWKRRGPWQ